MAQHSERTSRLVMSGFRSDDRPDNDQDEDNRQAACDHRDHAKNGSSFHGARHSPAEAGDADCSSEAARAVC
jgi:hypothetical protein